MNTWDVVLLILGFSGAGLALGTGVALLILGLRKS
jgi:hypothetical protein